MKFSSFWAYLTLLSEDGDLAFYLSPDIIGCIWRTTADVLDTVEHSKVWLRWKIMFDRESSGIFWVEHPSLEWLSYQNPSREPLKSCTMFPLRLCQSYNLSKVIILLKNRSFMSGKEMNLNFPWNFKYNCNN